MIVFAHSVQIARAPEDVFAFLTDPAKLSQWQDLESISQLTPGPVGPGTRFREIHKALGRRRVEITEVVTYEPARRFEIRMVQGVPLDGRWDFDRIADGTRLTMTPSWRLPPWLAVARPALSLLTVISFAVFDHRLKRALEGSPPTQTATRHARRLSLRATEAAPVAGAVNPVRSAPRGP